MLLQSITCPLCDGDKYVLFAEENSYKAVRCSNCGLIYVNPRPDLSLISEAVNTGVHSEVEGGRNVVVRRSGSKVNQYKKILSEMFTDKWEKKDPISWLDVGAGYGEFIEAVGSMAPNGSNILGIEPMHPKVIAAQKGGLNVKEMYLADVNEHYDIISLINVFSHLPNIKSFLNEVKQVLKQGGELFLETGNIADLESSKEVPTELDLPDHLIFAGERQIELWLSNAGFEILSIKRLRKDIFSNLLKNIVKKILGRKVTLALPYTSAYRSLLVRARLL